jgi:ketosteroid isomerase-like protein
MAHFAARMTVIGFLIACSLMVVPGQPLQAQIPVQTRLVKIYAEYEQRLIEAINRRDQIEIDRLVADDFEMIVADHPGTATPRADWIARLFKMSPLSTDIEQMAVHEFGDVHVVSFSTKASANTTAGSGEIMIVDVWLRSGERSTLKTRYAAASGRGPLPIPGDDPVKPNKKRL